MINARIPHLFVEKAKESLLIENPDPFLLYHRPSY